MNSVTSNYVPVKKKRILSGLAWAVKMFAKEGITSPERISEITGHSIRAIKYAKAQLAEVQEVAPDAGAETCTAGAETCTAGAEICTVQEVAPVQKVAPPEVQKFAPEGAEICTPADAAFARDAQASRARARIDNNYIYNNINNNNINNTTTGVVASTTRTRESAGLVPAPSPIPEQKKPAKSIFNRDQLVFQLRQFVNDKPLAEKTIDMLLERYDLDVLSGAMIRLRLKDDEEEIKSYTRMLNLLAEDVCRDHARGIRRDVLPWGAKVLPNGAVLSQW